MVHHPHADRIARRTHREATRLQRDWRIRDLLRAGVPAKDVAAQFGLTPARIYQIGNTPTP